MQLSATFFSYFITDQLVSCGHALNYWNMIFTLCHTPLKSRAFTKCQHPVVSFFFSPFFFLTESCYGNSFSWITFSVSGLWPNLTLSVSSESGGHGGKLDLCVFSWLTGKNLSLPVPVEKERIVECRPWQSIPWVLMVGLSWTASSTADIYTQLTQVPERKTEKSVRMRWEKKKTQTCINLDLKFKPKSKCPLGCDSTWKDFFLESP